MTYKIPSRSTFNLSRRQSVRALLAAAVTVGVALPATASAADSYTVDGAAASAIAARSSATCAGFANTRGVIQCFTSDAKMINAQATAARAGKVPPGWDYLPTNVSNATTADTIAGNSAAKPAARSSAFASPNAAGDSCNNYTSLHIYNDAFYQGTSGVVGPTAGYHDLSSDYSNHISSYYNSNSYTTNASDYTQNGGAHYGPVSVCHYNSDLSVGPGMSDGATANDRISSIKVGS